MYYRTTIFFIKLGMNYLSKSFLQFNQISLETCFLRILSIQIIYFIFLNNNTYFKIAICLLKTIEKNRQNVTFKNYKMLLNRHDKGKMYNKISIS